MGVAEASAVAGEVAVVDLAVAVVVSAVAGEDVAVASGEAEEVTAGVDVVDSEVEEAVDSEISPRARRSNLMIKNPCLFYCFEKTLFSSPYPYAGRAFWTFQKASLMYNCNGLSTALHQPFHPLSLRAACQFCIVLPASSI